VTIVWSRRAVTHLTALRKFISVDKPTAASRMATVLVAAVERLKERPALGRPGRIGGTRETVVPRTPHVIAYRLRSDRLEVLGLFHGRRKWPVHL